MDVRVRPEMGAWHNVGAPRARRPEAVMRALSHNEGTVLMGYHKNTQARW